MTMPGTPKVRRLRLNPCETPGCSGNCAYAWSCHNQRMGMPTVFWAGIGLGLFIFLGLVGNLIG